MYRPPLALRRAIARGGRIVILCEVEHPDGMVWVCSRSGPVTGDGKTWKGVGTLGRISGIGGAEGPARRPFTLLLRGVPPDVAKFVTARVRNHKARVWMAALKPRVDDVDGDLHPLAEGLCDTQTKKVADDRNASIEIVVNGPIHNVDRAQNKLWSAEWLKRTYGSTLTGGDELHRLSNAQEIWEPLDP